MKEPGQEKMTTDNEAEQVKVEKNEEKVEAELITIFKKIGRNKKLTESHERTIANFLDNSHLFNREQLFNFSQTCLKNYLYCKKMCLVALPDELKIMIFSKLPLADLVSMMLTSKSYKSLCLLSVKKLSETGFHRFYSRTLISCLPNFGNLTLLDTDARFDNLDFLKYTPHLEHLRLANSKTFTGDILIEGFSHLPRLKYLQGYFLNDLTESVLSFRLPNGKSLFPQLETLYLRCHDTFADVTCLLTLPSLKSLILFQTYEIKDLSPLARSETLQNLDVVCQPFRAESATHSICSLVNLKQLRMTYDDTVVKGLSKFSNLEVLEVRYGGPVPSIPHSHDYLRFLTKLKNFTIADHFLDICPQHFPMSLVELNIKIDRADHSCINFVSLDFLATLKNLKILNLDLAHDQLNICADPIKDLHNLDVLYWKNLKNGAALQNLTTLTSAQFGVIRQKSDWGWGGFGRESKSNPHFPENLPKFVEDLVKTGKNKAKSIGWF